jgi:hypothetical protein
MNDAARLVEMDVLTREHVYLDEARWDDWLALWTAAGSSRKRRRCC